MKEVDQNIWRDVNIREVASSVKELKNWKSPGVDKIPNLLDQTFEGIFPPDNYSD